MSAGSGPVPQEGDHLEVDLREDGKYEERTYRDAELMFETDTHFQVRYLDDGSEELIERERATRWHSQHEEGEDPRAPF